MKLLVYFDKPVQRTADKMAFLNKEYKLVKSENFDTFLKSIGMPEERIKLVDQFKPTVKLVKNADGTYTDTTVLPGKPKVTTFTPGVEFDDVENNIPIKALVTIDGNVVTQVIKSDKGTATFKKEYNGDDLTVTITADSFDGVAKRYFKA